MGASNEVQQENEQKCNGLGGTQTVVTDYKPLPLTTILHSHTHIDIDIASLDKLKI